ncbi:Aste57867_20262 [Aphanomyces stellatus]|uniref:Aste57867_20262 protein n=1 Tax=Aphanomyces stellatus TaxID=120398 RepID=A0A485LER4_9STRA|nr:hypothetical protein As57867_020196 [Aphanomyces stellatus]VFT96952.1 Aste57867_20262 [Aphanomyces stellatus]
MSARNDDELEQNWAAETVTVDDGEDSDVEVEDDDEEDGEGGDAAVADDEVDAAQAKKRARDPSTPTAEPAAKKKKPQKSMKGLQNMTQSEHFKIVNDVYAKLYGDNLTPLEIANGLVESHFATVPNFGKHNLDSLSRFLRSLCPKWKLLFKGKGIKDKKSPILLIVCSSALRAVEVGKAIAVFKCHVAKLFAKHLKLSEQVDNLKRFHPIAIGTPGRIKTLLEMKALSLECTTHVVLDMYRDSKNMSILELKDTAKDTVDCIREHMLPALASQSLSLALY